MAIQDIITDTACCKNPYKKQFYNFDDHEVREAQARQIKVSHKKLSLCMWKYLLSCSPELCCLYTVLHIFGSVSSKNDVLNSTCSTFAAICVAYTVQMLVPLF